MLHLLLITAFLQRTFLVMGTEMTVRFAVEGNCSKETAETLAGESYRIVKNVEEKMSGWVQGSYTDLLNKGAGKKWVEVSDAYINLLRKSQDIYRLTNGAFDITACPLIKAVREGKTVDTANLVGMNRIKIKGDKVFLPKKGMCLDVDGILKGYALDKVFDLVKKRCSRFYVEIGGDVCGMDTDVVVPYGGTSLLLHIKEGCVASSGVAGKEYDDVVDARIHRKKRMCEVAGVYHREGAVADALATYLLIEGKKGFKTVEKAGGEGFCWRQNRLDYTDGLKNILIRHP